MFTQGRGAGAQWCSGWECEEWGRQLRRGVAQIEAKKGGREAGGSKGCVKRATINVITGVCAGDDDDGGTPESAG